MIGKFFGQQGITVSTLMTGLMLVLSACASSIEKRAMLMDDSALPARIQLMADSARLFRRGEAKGDALAMALAAEMRADALGGWRVGDSESALTPAAFLAAAKKASAGDAAASEIIRRIEARRMRGGVDGPLIRTAVIGAGKTFEYTNVFEPRQPAIVYVESAKATDFVLTVMDADNNEVCEDNRKLPRKICRWRVSTRDEYSVRVSNSGDADLEVFVIVN